MFSWDYMTQRLDGFLTALVVRIWVEATLGLGWGEGRDRISYAELYVSLDILYCHNICIEFIILKFYK